MTICRKILGSGLLGMAFVAVPASAAELSLQIADIVAPAFAARGVALTLPVDGSAELRVASLRVQQREFRKVRIRCAGFSLSGADVSCRQAGVDGLPGALLDFSYGFDTRQFRLALMGAGGESWQVAGQLGEAGWQVSARLEHAQAKRLAAWLPADMPLPNQGRLDGTLSASGSAAGMDAVHADLRLEDAGFSDASGLHAAEKLRGTVRLDALRKSAVWHWKTAIAWQSGEVFWQPLYLAGTGSRSLNASGSLRAGYLDIERAVVVSPQIGKVRFAARWDGGGLAEAEVQGDDLGLERLFADYVRPFFDKGALASSSLSGRADLDWRYRDGATRSLRLVLRDAGIADSRNRFALRGVNTALDWRPDASGSADIAFAGGALLGAPLGSGQVTLRMRGLEFGVAQAVLPVMDGKLELRDFKLRRAAAPAGGPCDDCPPDDAWHWQFSAALSRISMERFSEAAGWPRMGGTLAGRIPRVSYDGEKIRADGALLFEVFDGTVVASRLELANPFGRAPRLSGNLNMRDLDLDLLTRTFSFGNMQGRIDVDVNGLELQDWQPARFDARIASSAGNYPKKISQKAVQNISALGGAGAAAAIQRSYLRFFENFGYDRIGWRCVLRNGVCTMGGVEDANSGPYAIVKGGGIPAITVMGYNRAVSWGELVTRLKRVTQGNVQAVVK
ncbi:MAG: hypothetical protein IPM27_00200 [Nitrosomonadales bacterium]|nr:hypothetical protein [Nitrosomonadales bacterium]